MVGSSRASSRLWPAPQARPVAWRDSRVIAVAYLALILVVVLADAAGVPAELVEVRTACGRARRSPLRLRGGFDAMNDGFRNGRASPMAIKRIQSELASLKKEPPDFFRAQPLNDDLLDWHFVLLGAENSVFERGLFHGRIMLDQDYPMKPPRVIFLTETGRFEVGVPVCLTITSHHAECWQPTWDIRTALTAIRAFMETPAAGALGGIDSSDEDRINFAQRSRVQPRAMAHLNDCARPTQALQVHIRLHKELAKTANICTEPSKHEQLRIVESRGCLLGAINSLLQRTAIACLTGAQAFGGASLEKIVEEVWGADGGDRLAMWVSGQEEAAQRGLRSEVANLTESNVRLERALAYKEQQRLKCLGDAVAAEERAEKAEGELEELKGHLQRLLNELSSRDQALSDMASLENPLAMHKTALGSIDGREAKSAAEAERLLAELMQGKLAQPDEIKKRLEEAKSWAMTRLKSAEVAKSSAEDAAEAERRDRLRARLEGLAAADSFKGMTFPKGGVDLDSVVPKWLDDRAGIH